MNSTLSVYTFIFSLLSVSSFYSTIFHKHLYLGSNSHCTTRISNSVLNVAHLTSSKQDLYMAFGYDNKPSTVVIESPSINSRRITSSILIDADIDVVWSLLTDYNNLATHVPNLVRSFIVPSSPGNIRIFQEGAQKIIGFDFRASLSMDMTEESGNALGDDLQSQQMRKIGFKLVESSMLSSFDGEWVLRCHSRKRVFDAVKNNYIYRYKTKLTYSVFVRPKGPVPVLALEWRVKEDIPTNLIAVKNAVEKLIGEELSAAAPRIDWGTDETLGAYINSRKKPGNFLNANSSVLR